MPSEHGRGQVVRQRHGLPGKRGYAEKKISLLSPAQTMAKRETKKPGSKAPPARTNRNGKGKRPSRQRADANTDLTGNAKLMEQVCQIIAETPEIRPERVGPLQEAVEQGTYSIDVRKLANILIMKLYLNH
jgi:flagellar biosynthesis anti-sigma factor FlgM